MMGQIEEQKIEMAECKKHIEIYEEKIAQQRVAREEKLNAHISTIKELEREVDSRGQKIRELQKQKEASDLKAQEECSQLREELEISRERISNLTQAQAIVEVYKKKIEGNA